MSEPSEPSESPGVPGSSAAPGVPAASRASSTSGPEGWRWAVTVIRIAVAKVALEFLSGRHLWFQLVAVPLGVAAFIWLDRWLGGGILALALVVFLVYRLVTWVIERLSMPKHVRKALDGAKDEIRAELERLRLPTGPISGVRFAGRLVRGKHPRAELVARMKEGTRTIGPIVSRALASAGARAPAPASMSPPPVTPDRGPGPTPPAALEEPKGPVD